MRWSGFLTIIAMLDVACRYRWLDNSVYLMHVGMQCTIQEILAYSYNNMSEDYFYIPIASIYHSPGIITITVN